ncbi:unnamed protein product [Rotaria magnacalcarata]|uniref:Uncharacterized protein n=1 Tax=Rotaria magnacalcarata TaxID=392030 RepID=A0A814G2L5_9BILA|nr:unnamed protein product [Rotaria magnacalcarata]CAF1473506.1 unnamed protein product [Rotaria magnacalcarata]CAF2240436.1 unnamed protein product [Rotaria magnacalcarata]
MLLLVVRAQNQINTDSKSTSNEMISTSKPEFIGVRNFPCNPSDKWDLKNCRLYCSLQGWKRSECQPYMNYYRCVCY